MINMLSPRFMVAIAIAAPLIAAFAMPHPFDDVPTPAQLKLAQRWLRTSCARGDAPMLTNGIHSAGNALLATFASAHDDGPNATLLETIDSASARLYRRMRRAILAGDTVAFANVGSFLAKPPMQYIVESRTAFSNGYRSRALVGLGVIGTAEARIKLQSVADSQQSDFASSASAIIAELDSLGHYFIK